MFFSISLDQLFSACAWIFSALYLIRMLLSFGGAVDSEGVDSLEHHASDHAFQLLTFNTLIGFLMMFGWGGLAASRQYLLSDAFSILIAILTGALFVFMTRWLFRKAGRLVSSGTQLNIQSAVGKQGRVYQKIGENKRGVVQVTLDDFTRELDAISIDNREIPSFQPVEILKIVDEKTVVVRRIK